MSQQTHRKWRETRNKVVAEPGANILLDTLLALDRKVMETSMRLYSIPLRDRLIMQAENRRLHRALRKIRLVRTA